MLFSGGLDSTTALAWALGRYDRVHALTFDYGQRHRVEIALARKAARRLGVPQDILKVDLRQIRGSVNAEPPTCRRSTLRTACGTPRRRAARRASAISTRWRWP